MPGPLLFKLSFKRLANRAAPRDFALREQEQERRQGFGRPVAGAREDRARRLGAAGSEPGRQARQGRDGADVHRAPFSERRRMRRAHRPDRLQFAPVDPARGERRSRIPHQPQLGPVSLVARYPRDRPAHREPARHSRGECRDAPGPALCSEPAVPRALRLFP